MWKRREVQGCAHVLLPLDDRSGAARGGISYYVSGCGPCTSVSAIEQRVRLRCCGETYFPPCPSNDPPLQPILLNTGVGTCRAIGIDALIIE